jgi:hypothetical protein
MLPESEELHSAAVTLSFSNVAQRKRAQGKQEELQPWTRAFAGTTAEGNYSEFQMR